LHISVISPVYKAPKILPELVARLEKSHMYKEIKKPIWIWILLAILPLVHKSGIIFSFFVVLQLLSGSLRENKNLKHIFNKFLFYITTTIPLFFYVYIGHIMGPHETLKWWFIGYANINIQPDQTLNVLFFDGIISKIYFGFAKFDVISICQSLIVLLYSFVIVYYGRDIKKYGIFISGYITFLLAFLPSQEINSVVNYSIGLMPILVLNGRFAEIFLKRIFIIGYLILNLVWLYYSYLYLVK
jgi:hypothetical protein